MIEILLLGWKINVSFMLFNEFFLLILKSKKELEGQTIEKSIQEYFKNHSHDKKIN